MAKHPIEFSEDRHRGSMPHIRAVLDKLRDLQAHTIRCRCGHTASHLVRTADRGTAMCAQCANSYRGASWVERRGLLVRQ